MGTLCKNIENIDKGEKDYNSLEKIEEEAKSFFININPLSLQLKLTMTFVDTKKEEYSYPPMITFIHKLKNNNIGIIFNHNYLSIYSSNTFKLIYSIKPTKNNIIMNEVKYFDLSGFIESKNNDLLLWTSKIIIIYKKIRNSYKLLQIINEFKQGTNYIEYSEYSRYRDKETECYDLNSLHELRNGLSKQKIELNVENILEIKENNFILFQKKSITYRSRCVIPSSSSTNNDYRVSYYNIKNEEEKILVEDKAYFDSFSRNYREAFSKIKYIIKDKYLFINLPNLFYIYDLSQNQELIKEKEIKIKLLCNYCNDLIIAKDLNEEKIKIYQFKEGVLKFYNDFPFQDFRKIFRLNIYNFLTYSNNKLKILEIK